jgi:Tol biopolymer transport system component
MFTRVYSTCVLAAIAAFNVPALVTAATSWTDNPHATFQQISDGQLFVGAPAISRSGRVIAFDGYRETGNGLIADVYVADRSTGGVAVASVSPEGGAANGNSFAAHLTPDGRFVAFLSDASNLVAGDDNGRTDLFLRDLRRASTTRVDLAVPDGDAVISLAVSDKARVIAFSTQNRTDPSARHTDLFVYDRKAATTMRVPLPPLEPGSGLPLAVTSISGDGRFVVFETARALTENDQPQDQPPPSGGADTDVFVLDRHRDTIERVSVASSGAEGSGSSWNGHISDDGRFVVFLSEAAHLVANDAVQGYGSYDIFVRDRVANTTRRVSLDRSASEPNSQNNAPAISADGRTIVYQSQPIGGDGTSDLFIYDVRRRTTERVAIDSASDENDFLFPVVSAHGRFVALATDVNLGGTDTNGVRDVYVIDRRPPE